MLNRANYALVSVVEWLATRNPKLLAMGSSFFVTLFSLIVFVFHFLFSFLYSVLFFCPFLYFFTIIVFIIFIVSKFISFFNAKHTT